MHIMQLKPATCVVCSSNVKYLQVAQVGTLNYSTNIDQKRSQLLQGLHYKAIEHLLKSTEKWRKENL